MNPNLSIGQREATHLNKEYALADYSVAVSLVLTIALTLIGLFGWQHMLVSDMVLGWSVIGGSVAITVTSLGIATPATIVTLTLGILGMVGALPFTSVGLGVCITLGAGLVCSSVLIKKG